MICFLCNKNKLTPLYTLPNSAILKCQSCGLFIKQGKKQTVDKLYDDTYYDAYPYSNSFGLTRRYFKAKIEKIKKLTGKSSPYILDVGCGWGDFLEVVKGESLPYLGVDHSPASIKRCKEKQLEVESISIEKLVKQKPGQFDVITSFQTIEHVVEPVTFLKTAGKLLAPGGIILLTTPNNDSPLRFLLRGKWSVYNIDSHVTFFNKKTLRLTLEKAGFTKVSIRLDPPRFFSLSYILSRLNFPILNTKYSILNTIPVPTDPFGDLEAIATKE